jgi:hypothetical protein
MPTEHASAAVSTGQTWHEIEGLVEEIARCAKADISAQEFYGELLDRSVRALAAEGGAVWMQGAEGGLYLQYQINAAAIRFGADADAERAHLQLLRTVAEGRQARLFPPNSGGGGTNGQPANPTEFLLITSPLRAEDEAAGVLEIFQRPGGSPATQRGYLQLVEVLAELAADFHRNLELRELRDRAALWSRFDQFSRRVHGSLELDRAAYTIANEARRLLDCDRASVAVRRGRGYQIRAVSGSDEVDRRANSVRLLEQLVRTVAGIGRPLWHGSEAEELPPQIENALQAYLDESHSRTLGVIPLEADQEQGEATRVAAPLGALIVEQFAAERGDEAARKLAAVVARHSASALRIALDYHNLPLMPLMRAVGKLGWFARRPQLPVLLGVVALLAIGAAALALVPAELRIGSRGELRPEARRVVFAPSDGVVERLHISPPAEDVDPEQRPPLLVRREQVLVELRNSELEFEFTRVQGERQTAARQLSSVQLTLAANSSTTPQRERDNDLPARAEELKVQIAGLDAQLEVLRRRQEELRVKSPIDGQVLTWDASELLAARPVRRGQALLTVADASADWVLELRVPDHHAAHVLRAWEARGTDLQVEFKLKSDPGATHYGTVGKVAAATEIDDDRQASVLLTVVLTRELDNLRGLSTLRPGTTVVANVLCGRRSIGYVWLHDLFDAVRTWILF